MLPEFLYSSVLMAGGKKLTEKLIDSLYPSIKLGRTSKEDIQKAVASHMESTFEKCYYIKTILRDKRETFSSIYSDQGFILPDDSRVDQNKLIEFIRSGNTVVIQGTGGGGKSMFVRYLWLYYFAHFRESLPVFIELRNLNNTLNADFTELDLENYIFHSVVSDSGSLSQKTFSELLKNGKIVIFLDGFDEINHQHRDASQRAIVNLKGKNPKCTFVVTSREDERFIGWHQFSTIQVSALTKDECVNLLSKAPFDEEQRSKILNKVSNSLYDTHTSFLSNPLLAYMTLVTYAYNPNFSDKMFQFYELAFDALYYRHDLTKGGGYNRRFYTNLDKPQFQKFLSYFCLRTYYDQRLEYTAQSLSDYIDEVKRIEPTAFTNLDNNLFIKDIMESVCILKKDGVEFTYTHRKFQEYFAAYCISRVASRNLTKMFQKFSHRYNDEVLSMVYDLNPDLFREKYIKPLHASYKSFFDLKTSKAIIRKFVELTKYRFEMQPTTWTTPSSKNAANKSVPKPKRAYRESITIRADGGLNDMVRSLERLYDRSEIYRYHESNNILSDQNVIKDVRNELKIQDQPIAMLYVDGCLELYFIDEKTGEIGNKINSKIFDEKRSGLFLKEVTEKEALAFHSFVNSEVKKFDSVSETFGEFFS